MTLEGTKAKQIFVGIGGVDYDLAADFIFWDTTDLKVYRRSVDYPAIPDVLLTETSDYSVSGGEGENGAIKTVATYSDGFLLVIRELPRVQPYDMVQGDGFATDSVETQLDKLTAMLQEDDATEDLALRLVPEDFSGADMKLAAVNDKAERAGLFVGFDQLGNAIATSLIGDIASYAVTWLNVALAIVQRDLNGDFSARIINALTFIGNLTGNVIGNVVGNLTGGIVETEGSNVLNVAVVEIGTWDMDADETTTVDHGIADFTKIRDVSASIMRDGNDVIYPLNRTSADDTQGSIHFTTATQVTLQRKTGGSFDSPFFDDATNRGWLTIWYTD